MNIEAVGYIAFVEFEWYQRPRIPDVVANLLFIMKMASVYFFKLAKTEINFRPLFQ